MNVEQPLASPGSANDNGVCRAATATPGLLKRLNAYLWYFPYLSAKLLSCQGSVSQEGHIFDNQIFTKKYCLLYSQLISRHWPDFSSQLCGGRKSYMWLHFSGVAWGVKRNMDIFNMEPSNLLLRKYRFTWSQWVFLLLLCFSVGQ